MRIFFLCILFVLLVQCCTPCISKAQSPSADPQPNAMPPQNDSPAAAFDIAFQQERIRNLLSEQSKARQTKRELEDAQASIARVLTDTNRAALLPSVDTVSNAIETLKSSIASLKQIPTNETIMANNYEAIDSYKTAVSTLSSLQFQGARKYEDSLSQYNVGYDDRNLSDADRIIRRARSRTSNADEDYGNNYKDILTANMNLNRRFYEVRDGIPRSALSAQIQAAEDEALKLTPEKLLSEAEKYGQRSFNVLKKLSSELDREIARLQGQIDELQKSMNDITNTEKNRAETANKKTTGVVSFNERSFIAVYAMLGIVLLVFFLLRFFPESLAKSLIESRTMIEIVSMAFLLLVILILGNGEYLKENSLGTLLGTVAGYIFGRRSGPKE